MLVRPQLYCVVPPGLARKLLTPLRRHFAAMGVEVIVERRDETQRAPYGIRRKRALHLPRRLELPEDAAPHAGEIKLLQRMQPAGLEFADNTLLEVVALVKEGDALAASEMSWRLHNRVQCQDGEMLDPESVNRRLGAILDHIDEFEGGDELEFLYWVDGIAAQVI